MVRFYGIGSIAERYGRSATQADPLTDTAQQYAAVRANIATLEIGLDYSPTEISDTIGTLWHR